MKRREHLLTLLGGQAFATGIETEGDARVAGRESNLAGTIGKGTAETLLRRLVILCQGQVGALDDSI